jgi:hypothetical protein
MDNMDNTNKTRNLVAEIAHHSEKVEEYLHKLDIQPKSNDVKLTLNKYKLYELQGIVIKYNGDFKELYRELKTNFPPPERPM